MAAIGPLPLAEFLASLSDLGIRTTLDDQRRIALVLRAGGPWTIQQFRGVLSSLLVRDRDHVAEFRRRFDGFFDTSLWDPVLPVDVERALAELRGLAGEPRAEAPVRPPLPDRPVGGRAPARRWPWSVLAVLAIALLPFQESAPPGPPKTAVLPGPSTTTSTITTDRANTPAQTAASKAQKIQTSSTAPAPAFDRRESYIHPHSPVLKLKAFHPPPAPPFWADPWFLAIVAVIYAEWLWRWLDSVAQAPAPSDPPGDGPRLFRSGLVGGNPAPRLDRHTLDRVADSLGYFQSEESGRDLDPQVSVEKTVRNGGIPTPVFELRRQVRRVLILEDLHSETRAWNPIARELSVGLARRGVPVLHGLFAGVPDRFRGMDGSDQRIEDLEDERRGYLVLIFSDGKGLGPAAADFALERLARWPQVAWMQLQDRRFWDQTAARPALRGLPVFAADRKGLIQAMAAFATERAVREVAPSPESWRGLPPRPAEGSLKLHVEAILGDSLLWAQACAMAPPPIALGLADRLRERFHPELPPERIERLIALPGSRLIAGGLKLDQPVLAVLREGFAQQHGEQEAVLELLLEQMRNVEPEDRDSLAHQAWEWRLERIRLELDPEAAVERLAALALGPLRETIRTDLLKVWGLHSEDRRLPLRTRARSRYAAERLTALAAGREISPHELYRFRVWPEAGLAAAAVALVAVFLWSVSPVATPTTTSLSLARNTPGVTGTALVSIEHWQDLRWKEVNRLSLDERAQSSLPIPRGEVKISVFLPGIGMTRTRLGAHRPGTFAVELATESRTQLCREKLSEAGIIVTRCRPSRLAPAIQNAFVDLFRLVSTLPQDPWIAKIGIETSPTDPGLLGDILLASGAIDIVYTVSGSDSVARIQEHWKPWARQVRLISWTAPYTRGSELSEGSLADWPNLRPFYPSLPVPAEPKGPGVAETVAGTVSPDAGPSRESTGIMSPAGDESTVEEPTQTAPQVTGSREVPAAAQPSPCANPALSRCGDACVDLKTNPFHHGACFTITPSLSRAAAENMDSPPSWTDESIQRRRYYRLFYAWDDSKSSVIGRSLPTRTGWNRGKAPDSVELALSSAEVAGFGYALAITDLEIHCSGQERVANVNSEAREMYEKLKTQSSWRIFQNLVWRGNWRGPSETATDSGLAQSLGSALDAWKPFCSRER